MEEALRAHLLETASIHALVDDRVSWASRPQASALPAVCLSKVDSLPDYTMQGPSGLVQSRVQVDCWADTYGGARGLARFVSVAISGIDTEINGYRLRGGFLQGDRDFFDQAAGGTDLFRVSLDFIIWHD